MDHEDTSEARPAPVPQPQICLRKDLITLLSNVKGKVKTNPPSLFLAALWLDISMPGERQGTGVNFERGLAMRHLRALLCAAALLLGAFFQDSTAQGQQGPSDTLTIQVTSRLVFLDVTVLDKKGRPVVNGLAKDDFTITEDKRPQPIFSFEAPRSHTISALAGDENPEGKAPVTIFVLDLLNSSFEDFAFIRYSVRKYLAAQPPLLSSPAEMMVIGNESLELMQGPTRNKADLLYALDHLPPVIPYKWAADSFDGERFKQSLDALQQIALENKGVPGRKNIVWVGHGSPSFTTRHLTQPVVDKIQQYMHATTNMLVDARISLFVLYPGLKVGHFVNLTGRSPVSISAADAAAKIDNDLPFAEHINFGVFVNETGGQLFYNRNDVDAEIGRSQQLGSEYYTLTYQPRGGDADGKFRQIRVTPRDHNLRAVTKTGYYAPDKNAPIDPGWQTKLNLAEAARSTVPFSALDLKVSGIVRHPENHTADITLLLQSKGIDWQAIDNGRSSAEITLAGASVTGNREVVAFKVQRLFLSVRTQDPSHLAKLVTHLQITVRVPPKTRSIKLLTETANGGRIGAADLDRKAIEAAPVMPGPEPQLLCRQPCQVKPSLPPAP
jgi:VWFA-related protein